MTFPRPFGPYTLLARISAGGMAEVFRAREKRRGLLVALKKILPHIAEDDEFIAMFEDEARIVSRLEHPHIARMLDFGRVEGNFYIAFEYVYGKDLRCVFERSKQLGEPIPLPFLLYVFSRIGEGLSYAHARRDENGLPVSIVHRDISPQNIVVSATGDIKLIDFGIAKAQGKATRTQVGSIKGSFGYMSPEQACGGTVDAQTDVFAMGICLWELLTQQRLFDGDNELVILQKIRTNEVIAPSTFRPDVPPEFDRVVMRALATDLGERYRSAKELYRDLHALALAKGVLASRVEMATYMRQIFPELTDMPQDPPEESQSGHEGTADRIGWQGSQDAGPRESGNLFSGKATTMAVDDEGTSEALPKVPAPSAEEEDEGDTIRGTLPRTGLRGIEPPRAPPRPHVPTIPHVPAIPIGKRTLLGVHAPSPGGLTSSDLTPVAVPFSASTPLAYPAAPPVPRKRPPTLSNEGALPATLPAMATPRSTPPVQMDWDDEPEPVPSSRQPHRSGGWAAQAPPLPSARIPPPVTQRGGFRTPTPPPLTYKSGVASDAPPVAPPTAMPPVSGYRTQAAQTLAASGNHFSAPQWAGPQSQRSSQFPRRPTPLPAPVSSGYPAPPSDSGYAAAPISQRTYAATPPPAIAPPNYNPIAPQGNRYEATAVVRPPPSRTALFIGLAVALFVVCATVLLLVLVPRAGKVAVNVTDGKGTNLNRVEIFVDGKKHCDTSPCVIEGVSAGTHSLKVMGEGGVVGERTFVAEARKQVPVELVLNGSGTRGTGLRIAANQPGVKLFVDGHEVGPLPQEVHDLAPGDHKIRVVGSERYEPFERDVTLVKDEVADLGSLSLRVVRGKVTITLGTPGAKVYLVSGTDRRDLPTFPISVDIDTSKKSWTLEASRFGFSDYRQPITFADGQAEKTFNVQLEPKSPLPQFAATHPRTNAPATAPAPAAPASKNETPEKTAASTEAGEGFLNINSIPASSVVLDGKPIGSTPKVRVPVTPGNHTVVFVNAEQGLRKQVPVSIASGETKPVIGKLRE